MDSFYCPFGYEPGDCCNDPTRCETENDLVDRLAKDGVYDRPPLNPDKPGKAANAAPNRLGEPADAVKVLGETEGGYIVDADGWSFESCPSCGTLVGEWLTEDGPDVMLLVECPMCDEAARDEDWWF